ncbi:MAG: amidohydrolase family protein [Myxococcota bacterium]|nr:amidohydrolase family protein [Myxococcota bacterium]
MRRRASRSWLLTLLLIAMSAGPVGAQVAVHGDTVYTMAGEPMHDAIVVTRDGKVVEIVPAAEAKLPKGTRLLRAKVVTPGLIDAHSVVGLAGYLNQSQDQDQIDRSAAIQPELRAVDAYNPRERLVEWLRGFGVTAIHTGHAPAALISGQTMVVKTLDTTVEDALVSPFTTVATTLGNGGMVRDPKAGKGKGPGTRAKAIAMLRQELVKAGEYMKKRKTAKGDKRPARDLRMEALIPVLKRKVPLLVTAHRQHDILAALRLAEEFKILLVLDGAAEAYLVVKQIRESGFPVILHPPMMRSSGEAENATMELGVLLRRAGIRIAFQSGYESYVPKTRVVLFEAGVAAAHGLDFMSALEALTIEAARILGVDDRIGSLKPGKDADIALYDGDPLETTSHCIGVVINGEVVSATPR